MMSESERLLELIKKNKPTLELSDSDNKGSHATYEVRIKIPYGRENEVKGIEEAINSAIQKEMGMMAASRLTRWAMTGEMMDDMLREDHIYNTFSIVAKDGNCDECRKVHEIIEVNCPQFRD